MSPRAKVPHRVAPSQSPGRRPPPVWAVGIICIGALAYGIAFVVAVAQGNNELLGGLTLCPVLVAATVPIALHIARSDRDRTLAVIVMAAVSAKLAAAMLRFYVAFEVYGNSDSLGYHIAGTELATNFRGGNFNPNLGPVSGTVFIKVFTGIVYSILGVSRITAFFLFAWIGFLGLVLIARAFRIAVPTGDSRRYLILVLLLPSLLYWPSAIGKEAWMMLAIGLCAYGIACLLRGRMAGCVSLGIGLVAAVTVRPHMALLVFIGFVVALLVRRAPARSFAVPLIRFAGLAVLLVLGLALAGETASFLGEASLTTETVSGTLKYNEEQTADGGSEFSPVVVQTPLDLAPAFGTVIFRPFPFEATNLQSFLASAEGLFLFALCCASWRRIRSIPRMARDTPYIAFCIGYVLAFVYAFSSFSNFGILARQRVQALPFLLVFLALPDFQTLPKRRRAAHAARRVPVAVERKRRRRPVKDASAESAIEPSYARTSTMRDEGSARATTNGSYDNRDGLSPG